MAVIWAVYGDLHAGSKLGLCLPYFELVDEDAYHANKGQVWAHTCWMDFWKDVAILKARLGQRGSVEVRTICVGDAPERGYHSRKGSQHFARNPVDVLRLGVELHQPVCEVADTMFFIKGSMPHAGNAGWLEEALARDLEAEQNPETPNAHSWWFLRIEDEGVKGDFYHRPPTQGWLPHTEDAAASRASFIIRLRCVERGEDPPDLAFFGHVHYAADSGKIKKPRVFFCRGWQLPYDWIHHIGKGAYPPPLGGYIVVLQDGEFEVIDKKYEVKRGPRWRSPSKS